MAEGTNSGTEVPVSDAVVGTEVRVSGADTGVVGPVRAAVTTASTLSEADIAIIVDRVTRNLQPPAASGTSMCPASSEGERDTVVDSCAIVRVWEGLLCKAARALVTFGLCGSVRMDSRYSGVYIVVHHWGDLVFAKGEQ